MLNDTPSFVLVGHANQGKSSIVSTLAYDDSVAISSIPGETVVTELFALKIDGKTLYRLYDTPGFQNPRKVLDYLQKNETTIRQRPQILAKFLQENIYNPRFKDEIELLKPIVDGGTIIYIIDTSKPYSQEYEVEMEILSWSARPSMALLNNIGDDDYSQEWMVALRQYFNIIHRFNPIEVTFKEKVKLLQKFALLDLEREKELEEVIEILKQDYNNRIEKTANLITEYAYKSISYRVRSSQVLQKISVKDKEFFESKYKNDLINFEKTLQKDIQNIWGHVKKDTYMDEYILSKSELFSKEFSDDGLVKKSLIALSTTTGGAVAGVTTFAFSAPSSALDGGVTTASATVLSTIGGATAGFVGGVFGYKKFLNTSIVGSFIGEKKIQIGPMQNLQFLFILSSRNIEFANAVLNRSHAYREKIKIKDNSAQNLFDENERKAISKIHNNFKKNKDIEKTKKIYHSLIREKIMA